MTPRPYQTQCVEATELAFVTHDRVLDVLPTGAGKTIIFSWLAKRWAAKGQRTLILAHREELIDQAIAKLHDATGIVAEKEKAEFRASIRAPVVVASVQSMIRRLDKWPQDHFGLVVADEAHHAISDSWQKVLRHFNGKILGVTATPHRGDMRNLGGFFRHMAFEVSLFDLIRQKYLSPIVVKSIPLRIDLSQVKSIAGDFDAASLGNALEPYLDQIAAAIRDNASFRRVLCFLPLIATSEKFVAACRAAGLSAEHIDGESPDRAEKLARFRNFEFEVLSNAMLLTEGFDDPGIDCVVCLRPTRSQPLFAQMVGRGTRPCEGKQNLLLLDFLWLHEKHAISRPANLIARDDFEAKQITDMYQAESAMPADVASQMPLDLEGLAGVAEGQREEALRKALEEQRKRDGIEMSAEEFAHKHNATSLLDYTPRNEWEAGQITAEQRRKLLAEHIDPDSVKGHVHALKILEVVYRTRPLKLADAKTRALMCRIGFQGHRNWNGATFGDGRRFFAELGKRKKERAMG